MSFIHKEDVYYFMINKILKNRNESALKIQKYYKSKK